MARKTASQKKADAEEALRYLRDSVQSGDTVHAILRHVSRSGTSRVVDLKLLRPSWTGEQGRCVALSIGYLAARACGYTYDPSNQGIRIGGCGFDAAGEVVSALAWKLFDDERALTYTWL